jgi:triacylglycerol lipase
MPEPLADPSRDLVIVLHGLGRSIHSLWPFVWSLRLRGWRVRAVGYPSQHVTIAEATDLYLRPVLESLNLPEGAKVHFVTHSLGGLIFRSWAASRPGTFPLGRSVLLVPPNQGSEIIDLLRGLRWSRWLLGPVVDELGTRAEDTARRLGPVPPETGVLMGNRVIFPLFSHVLGSENDGMVTVHGGRVEGLADFVILPIDHFTVLFHPRVWRAAHLFLIKGRFPTQES